MSQTPGGHVCSRKPVPPLHGLPAATGTRMAEMLPSNVHQESTTCPQNIHDVSFCDPAGAGADFVHSLQGMPMPHSSDSEIAINGIARPGKAINDESISHVSAPSMTGARQSHWQHVFVEPSSEALPFITEPSSAPCHSILALSTFQGSDSLPVQTSISRNELASANGSYEDFVNTIDESSLDILITTSNAAKARRKHLHNMAVEPEEQSRNLGHPRTGNPYPGVIARNRAKRSDYTHDWRIQGRPGRSSPTFGPASPNASVHNHCPPMNSRPSSSAKTTAGQCRSIMSRLLCCGAANVSKYSVDAPQDNTTTSSTASMQLDLAWQDIELPMRNKSI